MGSDQVVDVGAACPLHDHPTIPSDARLKVHLSGGGVRAAYCAMGSLWWLGREFDPQNIDEIISVSGGTLPNVALAIHPSTHRDEWMRALLPLFRRTRFTLSAFAGIVTILGSFLWLLLLADSSRDWLFDHWWLTGSFLTLWLLSLGVSQCSRAPLALFFLALLTGSLTDHWFSDVVRWVPIVLGLFVFLRRHRASGMAMHPGWIVATILLASVVGAVVFAGVLPAFIDDGVWLATLSWLVSTFVVQAVIEAHLLRMVVGRDLYSIRPVPGRPTPLNERCSMVCLADLRTEQAVYAVMPRPGHPAVLLGEDEEVLMDLPAMRLGRLVRAAVSFSTPVYPWGGTAATGRERELPVLVDGGIQSTLGIRRDAASDSESWRIVVDATRHPAPIKWWPLISVPRFGSRLLQVRFLQTLLSKQVSRDRALLSSMPRTMVARATGYRLSDPCSCLEPELVEHLVTLRRQADGALWRPTQLPWVTGSAIRAVAAGAVATMAAVRGRSATAAEARAIESSLRADFLARPGRGSMPARPRSGRLPLGACLRWATVLVLAVPSAWEVIRPTDCGPVCRDRPGGVRHPFFGAEDEFIAMRHGPTEGDIQATFREAYDMGFRYMETDIVFTSDSRLVAAHQSPLEGFSDGVVDEATAEGHPTLLQLLDDPAMPHARWSLEVNLQLEDEQLRSEMNAMFVAQVQPYQDRVCIHFGRTVSADRAVELLDLLPTEMCSCATVVERGLNSTFPLLRAMSAIWRTVSSNAPQRELVDCAVVPDQFAESAGEVGSGVVRLSWPLLPEDDDLLNAVLDTSVDGIITNDPLQLKYLLIDEQRWVEPEE